MLETEFSGDKPSIKSSLKVISKSPGSLQTVNVMQNGLKKIIKETKSFHVDDITTLTVGRSKRVQFNTLPELPRSRNNKCNNILKDSAKQDTYDSNFSKYKTKSQEKEEEEETPVDTKKNHMNLETGEL